MNNKEKLKAFQPNYLYKANAMMDGKVVIGALISYPPFSYIATIEALNNMSVNELDEGRTENLKLIRILEGTIEEI